MKDTPSRLIFTLKLVCKLYILFLGNAVRVNAMVGISVEPLVTIGNTDISQILVINAISGLKFFLSDPPIALVKFKNDF